MKIPVRQKRPRQPSADAATQADVINRLRRSGLPRRQYAGLAKCKPKVCGRKRCSDICVYGTKRRLKKQVRAAQELLQKSDGPYFEIFISRAAWSREPGQLQTVTLGAAKQLSRRALDTLQKPTVVAVGMFKAWFDRAQDRWKMEVHLVVAGLSREELEKAIGPSSNAKLEVLCIREVSDLPRTVRHVLHQRPRNWRHPLDPSTPIRLPRRERAEYYRWAFKFKIGGRVIRYGCDRHFNRLKKTGPTIRVRPRKRRSYPYHLIPHMFGGDKWRHGPAPGDMTFEPKRKNTRVTKAPKNYYED